MKITGNQATNTEKSKKSPRKKSDERVSMYDAWYYVHTIPSMVLWRSALRALRVSFSATRSIFIFFSLVGDGPVTAAIGRAWTAT
jgi:hypothetical protein